jgi:hypothetical protein
VSTRPRHREAKTFEYEERGFEPPIIESGRWEKHENYADGPVPEEFRPYLGWRWYFIEWPSLEWWMLRKKGWRWYVRELQRWRIPKWTRRVRSVA